LLAPFLAKHPQVDIELILDDRGRSGEGGRRRRAPGRDLPPDAIARQVAVSPRQLVAAPSTCTWQAAQTAGPARFNYIRFACPMATY
jgi:hypothetical protein